MAKKYKNIRERDGKYFYRYSIPVEIDGKLGRKQTETKGFDTPEEAQEAGDRIKAELTLGIYIDETDMLFSRWCDTWLTDFYATTGRVKESTIRIRRQILSRAKEYFSGKKLKDITAIQYQTYLNWLKSEGKAKKTITMQHESLKMVFRKAHQMKLIGENITLLASIPGFQQTVEELENEEELPTFYEKEQLGQLLRAAKVYTEVQMFPMIFLLAYSGLRIGELCALNLLDFNEISKQVSVTKTLHHRGAYADFSLGTPKTPSSKRKVEVSETVVKVIKSHLAWRREYKMSIGKRFYNDREFLFINHKFNPGYPFSPRDFAWHLDRILESAGLPHISPHSLRHTFTSLMAEAGLELAAIQKLLGHHNDETTKKVYLHVTEAKKRAAVEKMDKLMDGLF